MQIFGRVGRKGPMGRILVVVVPGGRILFDLIVFGPIAARHPWSDLHFLVCGTWLPPGWM